MRGAEGHRAHLRLRFFQREVVMAAGGQLDAGYFAGNPDIGEFVFERRADGGIQLADGEDAAGRGEIEGELIHSIDLTLWGGRLRLQRVSRPALWMFK